LRIVATLALGPICGAETDSIGLWSSCVLVFFGLHLIRSMAVCFARRRVPFLSSRSWLYLIVFVCCSAVHVFLYVCVVALDVLSVPRFACAFSPPRGSPWDTSGHPGTAANALTRVPMGHFGTPGDGSECTHSGSPPRGSTWDILGHPWGPWSVFFSGLCGFCLNLLYVVSKFILGLLFLR
jgi:hypothetical protein